jgi:bifunctional enzyme CysN/CysC
MDAALSEETRAQGEQRDLVRFITCGSVDDGKSTLIGRLLHESRFILDDQLAALVKDSARHGTTGEEIDFALLVDGLEAEREQGITIDVAYRFFATSKRSFIVADTPGHEQYTRNMATGASNAHLAVILIDARKGVLAQTRRHSFICSLFGIRHVVVAVNKMDLVNFEQDTFERIVADYKTFASHLGFLSIVGVPISARYGDNIIERSSNTPWYRGQCLLSCLEGADISTVQGPFRFSVQWVNRPNLDFRGYAGTVASGSIAVGDAVVAAASGLSSRVSGIVCYEGPREVAEAGDAVTITLADEIDVARGDMLVSPKARPEVSDQFSGHVIWMDQDALMPGRSYMLKLGTNTVSASITAIKYRINVNTGDHLAATTLGLNEIGFCNFSTESFVAFDPYSENRKTGSFIVIDRFSNRTIAAGMIAFGLRRGTNLHWQPLLVGKTERAGLKHQKPVILWLTGLSGAGKSAIANIVELRLNRAGYHTMLLDGDNVRHGLNRDLGFTEADRVENIRRVGEVAKLMLDSGLIIICSFISPYRAERDMVRRLVADGEFIEIFVDTAIEECMKRDPKGLYAKAKAGTLRNFTGIDAPYEAPGDAEVHLQTAGHSAEDLADIVLDFLRQRLIIS